MDPELYYLVPWEFLDDFDFGLVDEVSIVTDEGGNGLWFLKSQYPDADGNGVPDLLQSGPGIGVTDSNYNPFNP